MIRLLLAFFALLFAGFLALAEGIAPEKRQSGFDMMSAETQSLQKDDLANPAMLWVKEGERLWNSAPENGERACAACHGDARSTMNGVAARYPAVDRPSGHLLDLDGRILQCRSEHQKAAPWARESRPLLALSAFIGLQSRGEMIAIDEKETKARAAIKRGRDLFSRRFGQLDLACVHCHDDNWGRKLGSATIPQGHPTAYPIYRLEWQGLGSLQRRMRNCMTGVRAEPFPYGAQEWIDLEAFLKARAAGMVIETPGIRP